jgi:hypothetical protein
MRTMCLRCEMTLRKLGHPCFQLCDETAKAEKDIEPIFYIDDNTKDHKVVTTIVQFLEHKGFLISSEESRSIIRLRSNTTSSSAFCSKCRKKLLRYSNKS